MKINGFTVCVIPIFFHWLYHFPNVNILTFSTSQAPSTLPRRNLITSTARPTVHTDPSRKRRFSKTLFKLEEFKTSTLRFSVENKAFRKRSHHDNHGIFLPKMTNDYCVFKFLKRSVDRKHLTRFQVDRVKPPFSNFSGAVSTGRQVQSYRN